VCIGAYAARLTIVEVTSQWARLQFTDRLAWCCGWAGGAPVDQADGDHSEPEAKDERDAGSGEGGSRVATSWELAKVRASGTAEAKASSVPATSSRIRPACSRWRRGCQRAARAAAQATTELSDAYSLVGSGPGRP
jgi:hypothetical protein